MARKVAEGTIVQVPARTGKYVCAKCHNKILVDDPEAVFTSELSGFLLSPEDLDDHRSAANDVLREKEVLVEAAEGEPKRLQKSENELFELYHAGQIAKADFGRRHHPISERSAQIEAELPRLQAERDVLKVGMLSRDEVMSEAKDLAMGWPDFSWEQRRGIIEQITDRVVVGKEGVAISLLHVPFGNDPQKAMEPRFFVFRRSLEARAWRVRNEKRLGPRFRG